MKISRPPGMKISNSRIDIPMFGTILSMDLVGDMVIDWDTTNPNPDELHITVGDTQLTLTRMD